MSSALHAAPYLACSYCFATYQDRTRCPRSLATGLSVLEGHWVAVANPAAAGVLFWSHR